MTFSEALHKLKTEGKYIAREGWNGKGMYLFLVPECHTMTLHNESGKEHFHSIRPWIAMYTVDTDKVPWVASQIDLLADDWCTVTMKDGTATNDKE